MGAAGASSQAARQHQKKEQKEECRRRSNNIVLSSSFCPQANDKALFFHFTAHRYCHLAAIAAKSCRKIIGSRGRKQQQKQSEAFSNGRSTKEERSAEAEGKQQWHEV